MIVKKPYAFLIKNFRLIHGFLLIILLYLSIKTINIYSFYSAYASTKTYEVVENLASNYINFLMFFLCIVVILVALLIYYLLSLKKKNNKTYAFMFLFYIILFIFYIFINSTFNGLERASLPIESITVYSEICLMALIPQIIFCFIVIGRVLGFSLNQFDFKNDLKELEIDSTDNEEVELTLGTDTYKIKRTFRKLLRLSKYFVLENKTFVIGSTSILIVAITIGFLSKLNVYNVTYSRNSNFSASILNYKINDTYLTNRDLYNNVVSNDKYFIVISVNISNNLAKEYTISRETFSLELNEKIINPVFSAGDKFRDLGEIFNSDSLKSKSNKDYVVSFEIPKSEIKDEYILRVKNFDETSGISSDKYKRILIKPKNIDKTHDKVINFDDVIDFKDTILGNYELVIHSFDIKNIFKESYVKEIDGETISSKYLISPSDDTKKKAVLKLTANFNKNDTSTYMSKFIINPVELFDYYGVLKYRVDGVNKETRLKKIQVDYNVDSVSYLEVPYDVLNANRIELNILIRGYKYILLLKEDN